MHDEQSPALARTLKNRHIQLIALGGAIGTGLFYGAAESIRLVGPGIVLSYLIGGGGLGITIASGLKLQQDPVLIVGGSLVAIIALGFDWIGAVAERYLRPRGL